MESQMLKDKVAIITGASYGMGQSMAEPFAEEGASVVLTARGKEKQDAVAEGIRPRAASLPNVAVEKHYGHSRQSSCRRIAAYPESV